MCFTCCSIPRWRSRWSLFPMPPVGRQMKDRACQFFGYHHLCHFPHWCCCHYHHLCHFPHWCCCHYHHLCHFPRWCCCHYHHLCHFPHWCCCHYHHLCHFPHWCCCHYHHYQCCCCCWHCCHHYYPHHDQYYLYILLVILCFSLCASCATSRAPTTLHCCRWSMMETSCALSSTATSWRWMSTMASSSSSSTWKENTNLRCEFRRSTMACLFWCVFGCCCYCCKLLSLKIYCGYLYGGERKVTDCKNIAGVMIPPCFSLQDFSLGKGKEEKLVNGYCSSGGSLPYKHYIMLTGLLVFLSLSLSLPLSLSLSLSLF